MRGSSVLTGTDAPEDGQQEDPVFGLLSQVQNSCYTGYDVSGLEVELAPGKAGFCTGARRQGYANRIPAADCVMADWLEAVYTDSQGNEVPIPLEREVHLD